MSCRHQKFSAIAVLQMKTIIWLMVHADPTQKIESYLQTLNESEFSCSREFVRRIFAGWRLSWKKPSYRQLQKYTPHNINYYWNFLFWISTIPWQKLKF